MFCSKCGTKMEPDEQFCPQCGQAAVSDGTANAEILPERSQKNTGLLIGLAVGAIVLATCAIVVTVIQLSAGQHKNTVPTVAQETMQPTQTPEPNQTPEPEQTPEPVQVPTPIIVEVPVVVPDTGKVPTSEDYLFPSDRVYITRADLRNYSKAQVALMRNEIYARHGYIFESTEYASYFSRQWWYHPNPSFNENMLTPIERANKSTIVEYEKDMGWR
jgi:hypothetical protein